ncbi:hypothetical protein C4D60_Mb11t10810 [Musa balbisiana]|uniref:Uncharacterized protein n=1 Tax=Musa balbisiana TaxID=52838 RepID=A0A4S8J377_MUSBA|nr:hypothetical protein C4D60_Mb11t10810 [Musa balbisiana]
MQAPQVDDYHGPQPAPPVAAAPAASSNFRNDVYPPAIAPSTLRAQLPLPAPWSTGLFDCCNDVGNWLLHGNLQVQNATLPPSVEGGMQR